MNTIRHQYDSNGRHRLVQLDTAGFLKEAGQWAGYTHISEYRTEGVSFIAATDYYAGTSLQPNKIYELKPIDSSIDGGSE